MCGKHYTRWRRHGDPTIVTSPHAPLLERIEAKLDRSGGPGACWPWTGRTNNKGYGVVGSGGKRGPLRYVHRAYYELIVGPIPDGLQIDHVRARGCTMKHCANPAHLEPVTASVNQLRWRSDVCKRGHPFESTPDSKGKRWCRVCRDERNRRRYNAGGTTTL